MSFSRVMMVVCSGLLLIASIIGTVGYYFLSEASWYKILIEQKIFYIPFVVFVPITAISIGLIIGGLLGYFIKQKFESIDFSIRLLGQGDLEKKITSEEDENFIEVQQVYKQIDRLRDKMKAQTILTQKLANERSESSGQTKEAILSEERHRIARELHDSVSQQLFAAMMLLSALNEQSEKSATPAMQKQLKMVESIVNESQSEMRALLLHLRPTQLEGKSLKIGIEQLLKELTTKLPIEVDWQIEDICLQKGIEDHLFRIVQELLSNTLRHSKAKLLEVRLVTMDNLAVMKVVDDGVGFDMSNVRQGSYGLQNMRERVAEFGGTIKIISFPGRGTSVEIKIPLVAKKDVESE
ncbi:sensor histidine kinase [Listeria sp. FSL L7-1485]|uniref:Sensor histidine kinase n=1 Tax=Listeria immobilis TaxID=2713502 RepID=A0A7X1C9I9_9LIST|nr:sensor histidine kinase [Listeria immobilis]MBC1482919.1 sensor histidine kinase [Listeria immobilis]MBC1489318.1 sensor histidine kinase [Listeria immobilis]MBC1507796.1 sensor histidine kinase [Listeria immobilis]MBC1510779.1 sensor histidine kinase [Listeria immobilis]MBC1536705.1 sensor histidine kinase [Listeria immobilis]